MHMYACECVVSSVYLSVYLSIFMCLSIYVSIYLSSIFLSYRIALCLCDPYRIGIAPCSTPPSNNSNSFAVTSHQRLRLTTVRCLVSTAFSPVIYLLFLRVLFLSLSPSLPLSLPPSSRTEPGASEHSGGSEDITHNNLLNNITQWHQSASPEPSPRPSSAEENAQPNGEGQEEAANGAQDTEGSQGGEEPAKPSGGGSGGFVETVMSNWTTGGNGDAVRRS